MNRSKFLLGSTIITAIAMVGLHHAIAKKGGVSNGTDILHFTINAPMTSTGVDPDVEGVAEAMQHKQGNANQQSLSLSLVNLDGNSTFDLLAIVGDETNMVGHFTTEANGAADLSYVKIGNGNGSPHGESLPNELNPVSSILALQVAQVVTQVFVFGPMVITNIDNKTLMTADFTDPESMQFLVKKSLNNDGADGDAAAALRIKASANNVQFRLRATGLAPSMTYLLAINGSIAGSQMSDAKGTLNVSSLPAGVPDVLDIHELAIWDSSSNSVLSTTLP